MAGDAGWIGVRSRQSGGSAEGEVMVGWGGVGWISQAGLNSEASWASAGQCGLCK